MIGNKKLRQRLLLALCRQPGVTEMADGDHHAQFPQSFTQINEHRFGTAGIQGVDELQHAPWLGDHCRLYPAGKPAKEIPATTVAFTDTDAL